MKDVWQAFRHDPPGQRFCNHYRRLHEGNSIVLRIVALFAGIVLTAGGVVLLFIPGPGLPLIAFGLALFAGESQTLASRMDRAEPRVRRWLEAGRQRWKQFRSRHSRQG